MIIYIFIVFENNKIKGKFCSLCGKKTLKNQGNLRNKVCSDPALFCYEGQRQTFDRRRFGSSLESMDRT